ncbi:MAG TPA: succinate dehydrogenase, cytochrome b556 subunit [Steroidobacteraceae bacterium]|nr:succinate dehydrogenase, cytochrome b556 subunit [Steroidobacteraceae bacterium]
MTSEARETPPGRARPLSPHLSVYRLAYTMVLSILHRMTGLFLALGLCALVYWLLSAAAGESAYGQAAWLLRGGLFRALLYAWLASFCYHFLNGLRHLAWDAGFGLERAHARRSGRLVVVLALVAFLIAAWVLFFPRAGAP